MSNNRNTRRSRERRRERKAYVVLTPNPVICLYRGTDDFTCYGGYGKDSHVHLECYAAHLRGERVAPESNVRRIAAQDPLEMARHWRSLGLL